MTNKNNRANLTKAFSSYGCTYDKGKLSIVMPFDTNASCGINLYNKANGELLNHIVFEEEDKIGNVYFKTISLVNPGDVTYQFFQGDFTFADPYSKGFAGCRKYGVPRKKSELKSILPLEEFAWKKDRNPHITYDRALVYCLHVRGFTKHESSGVRHKGTFAGVIEKLDYLSTLGVTTLEFQPIYEFPELLESEESEEVVSVIENTPKLNYWGYTEGFYYAPKAAYSSDWSAVNECKAMIYELHKRNMEAVLQFYFKNGTSSGTILDVLRFWVLEYHVDGFHLMGENIPFEDIAKDPLLAGTKLWYRSIQQDDFYSPNEMPAYKNLAVYEDSYLYDMRKFLKGDDDMIGKVIYRMRNLPAKMGSMNFFSNYYGFTLMDMLSYDRKHNEENGEENHDGIDYNCSWNCGEEGVSKKKKVLKLRKQLWMNAVTMLFFSNGTPLIFMGDEFGNSQKGNNNPYCQDNNVTWLNWKNATRNAAFLEYFRKMSQLREKHPVLRPEQPMRIMDYIACGFPDLSYHGENAWKPQMENYSRQIGILYCGKYAKKDRKNDDDFFYLAMNMHWEKHKLALPRLPKDLEWKLLLATDEGDIQEEDIKEDIEEKDDREELQKVLAPRSLCIFISEKTEKPKKNRIMRKTEGNKILPEIKNIELKDKEEKNE